MNDRIVYLDGNVPSIYFPVGLPEDGGSCAFLTERCVEYCPSGMIKNNLEVRAFKRFCTGSADGLAAQIYGEYCDLLKTGIADILQWHCWGDCLPELTQKTSVIIHNLNSLGVTQYGFTRNIYLWEKIPAMHNLRIGFTVDSEMRAAELSFNSGKLVCCPDVETGYAQEFMYGKKRAACSGWWCTQEDKETRNSDCVKCFEKGEGCFYRRKINDDATGFEEETLKGGKEYRRGLVKGLTCHHKDYIDADLDGEFWVCDKNGRECLVDGQCPGGVGKLLE